MSDDENEVSANSHLLAPCRSVYVPAFHSRCTDLQGGGLDASYAVS